MTALRRPPWPSRLVVHAAIWALAASMAAPLAWMLASSLKTPAEVLGARPALLPAGPPSAWSWSNYAEAWRAVGFGRFYLNSLVVAVAVTALSVAHGALAGYAFAKLRFRGRRAAFAVVMATMLLPFQVYFVFLYVLCDRLGYLGSLQVLIVPFLAGAFGIFYMRQAIGAVPESLLEAARIDGMGEWSVFAAVVVPMVRPALAALAVFTFMGTWNSFFWPLVAVDSTEQFTLPLAVARLTSDYFTPSPPVRMAAATILILPTVAVYLLFERVFVRGLTLTGVKG